MNQSAQSEQLPMPAELHPGCEVREGQVAESEGLVEIQRTRAITHNRESQTPAANLLTFRRRQIRPEVDGGGPRSSNSRMISRTRWAQSARNDRKPRCRYKTGTGNRRRQLLLTKPLSERKSLRRRSDCFALPMWPVSWTRTRCDSTASHESKGRGRNESGNNRPSKEVERMHGAVEKTSQQRLPSGLSLIHI